MWFPPFLLYGVSSCFFNIMFNFPFIMTLPLNLQVNKSVILIESGDQPCGDNLSK